MPVSVFVEILEPRWAPARLISGPLPPQFGVDLASFSVPLIEAGNDGGAPGSDDLSYSARLPDDREFGLIAQLSFSSGGWTGTFSVSERFLDRVTLTIELGDTPVLTPERKFLDPTRLAWRGAGPGSSTLPVVDPVL